MDQTDTDSTPDNLDGDPAEDDESSVAFMVGKMSDLELTKEVDRVEVAPNEMVQFSITVTNYGPDPASSVALEDIIPDGYADIVNISMMVL